MATIGDSRLTLVFLFKKQLGWTWYNTGSHVFSLYIFCHSLSFIHCLVPGQNGRNPRRQRTAWKASIQSNRVQLQESSTSTASQIRPAHRFVIHKNQQLVVIYISSTNFDSKQQSVQCRCYVYQNPRTAWSVFIFIKSAGLAAFCQKYKCILQE